MKKYVLLGLCSYALSLFGQAALHLETGSQMVVSDAAQLVLTDIKWNNDGTFSPDGGTVILNGSNGNTAICGTVPTVFNNLSIDKSPQQVILEQNIQIEGMLSLLSGNLELNQFELILNGTIIGESETNRITGGTGGKVLRTETYGTAANNPGNIGIAVTNNSALGNLTIQRGHVPQNLPMGSSIQRFFTFEPGTNGSNATLRLYYLNAELNGTAACELGVWQLVEGQWQFLGASNRNTTEKWVEISGITGLTTFTLGDAPASFTTICGSKKVDLKPYGTSIGENNPNAVWETSGDGMFVGGTTYATATMYMPGEQDRKNGQVKLTLRSTATEGNCVGANDMVFITVLKGDCGGFPWNG
ncbi:MAG: hypothetical protein ACK4TA_03155 [Saprospiraceae bacterium]